MTYGNPKWHWVDEDLTRAVGEGVVMSACQQAIAIVRDPARPWQNRGRLLAEGLRPALGRNNVCAKCKKAYIKTRPELQAAMDLLNDRKDI